MTTAPAIITTETQSDETVENAELHDLLLDITKCDFVSMDLEFSGLFTEVPPKESLAIYYKTCSESVSKFLSMQIGICTATQDPSHPNLWVLAPYNFFVLPSLRIDLTIFCSARCLLWILPSLVGLESIISVSINGSTKDLPKCPVKLRNRLPLHLDFTCRMDYCRLSRLQSQEKKKTKTLNDKTYLTLKSNGLQRILETIIQHEKPLVVHNGFLDLLHLYDKFIGELPDTLTEFCVDWTRLFTGGTFDTKHLAIEGFSVIFHLSSSLGTALCNLHAHLMSRHHKTSFKLADNRSACGYSIKYSAKNAEKMIHEAGFDALATAQIFLLEIESYDDAKLGKPTASKRRKVEPSITPDNIPSNWMKQKAVQQFQNIVQTGHVAPGYLNLSKTEGTTA
ncbi:CAF1 family ribonuclease [Cardiosporidium cionae]|uniref:CAF1 family ribonuclease n=1 Tax=Cardiosporidium cionae TaxID=476202 RepID=A0ABQ7JAJ0_9APIC|nr:CAF1 family ribonuclease [Cardiosporidium cionae]|eukprot:KAF8820984.1 CAF1 family ribonuclease [Cardiosporidium cionae]